jgi:RNA polymerase sigma-70 factor, ECF subfamily
MRATLLNSDVSTASRDRGRPGRAADAAEWDWSEAWRHCHHEARRVLRSSAEAEDAAQEALLRAWRSARTPEEIERPVAWLRRIARNEALRLKARQKRRQDEPLANDALDELPGGAGANETDRLHVVELLAALPPADRRLLWLRYFEDLTQATVARRLGIPEGTVKVRLHRVRARLRRMAR